MSKTNRERAKKLFYDYVETTETFTEIVTIALDKAERRGARKVCRCCKPQPAPQFYAEEVLGLIGALRDFAVDVGKGEPAKWCMDEARRRLLTALGLEGNDE